MLATSSERTTSSPLTISSTSSCREPRDAGRIEVAKAFLSMMRVAFPDYRFAVEDLIGEADKVVAASP